MSFPSFPSLPTLPNINIPNPFSTKSNETNDKSFELVKYMTVKDMYDYEAHTSKNFVDFLPFKIELGYITSKYVSGMKDTGCYIIMIESQISNGPHGIYLLARSSKEDNGIVNTLVQSKGKCNDYFEVVWNPMEHPCIRLRHNFLKKDILNEDTKLRLGFDIRVMTL